MEELPLCDLKNGVWFCLFDGEFHRREHELAHGDAAVSLYVRLQRNFSCEANPEGVIKVSEGHKKRSSVRCERWNLMKPTDCFYVLVDVTIHTGPPKSEDHNMFTVLRTKMTDAIVECSHGLDAHGLGDEDLCVPGVRPNSSLFRMRKQVFVPCNYARAHRVFFFRNSKQGWWFTSTAKGLRYP